MGLPLDTTAAQPKLKLYRYVSPSLSRSLPLPLPPLSLSLSPSPSQPVVSSFSPASIRSFSLSLPLSPFLPLSLSLCVYLPFRFSFSFLPHRSFSCLFLFLSTPSPFLLHIRGAIVNGLQPLPGIYPRNLPSASFVPCLAPTHPIPWNPSRGSTDCAL